MFFNIGLPVILILNCPILLWLLAKPPFRVMQPSLRFKITSILLLLFWAIALFTLKIQFWYWAAGLLVLMAFLIFSFMMWSVLCWGYTIRMLLVLKKHQSPLGCSQWQKLHAEPSGIEQLTVNCIQVLEKLQLGQLDGCQLILSRKGLDLARIGGFLMKLFGLC